MRGYKQNPKIAMCNVGHPSEMFTFSSFYLANWKVCKHQIHNKDCSQFIHRNPSKSIFYLQNVWCPSSCRIADRSWLLLPMLCYAFARFRGNSSIGRWWWICPARCPLQVDPSLWIYPKRIWKIFIELHLFSEWMAIITTVSATRLDIVNVLPWFMPFQRIPFHSESIPRSYLPLKLILTDSKTCGRIVLNQHCRHLVSKITKFARLWANKFVRTVIRALHQT